MTPEQLQQEIFYRLGLRFGTRIEPMRIDELRPAVAEICAELGLSPKAVVLIPSATHVDRIDYVIGIPTAARIADMAVPMTIEPEEVKRAMLGAVADKLVGPLDFDEDPTSVEVEFNGWALTLFAEGRHIGNVDYAEAPDGRSQSFLPHHVNPWQLLSSLEQEAVERAIIIATFTD